MRSKRGVAAAWAWATWAAFLGAAGCGNTDASSPRLDGGNDAPDSGAADGGSGAADGGSGASGGVGGAVADASAGGAGDVTAGSGGTPSGGSGGSTGGAGGSSGALADPPPCPTTSFLDEGVIARAAVALTSCSSDDGFWRTQTYFRGTQGGYTYLGRSMLAECLANITNGCAGVSACSGVMTATGNETCGSCRPSRKKSVG